MRRGLLLDVAGQRFLCDQDDTVLGRTFHADLVLEIRTMSRRHARVRRTPDGWTIADAGSTSGVLVNGERVSGARAVAVGDAIRLGSEVAVVVALDHVAASGELALRHTVRFGAPGEMCTGELRFRAATASAALERELVDRIDELVPGCATVDSVTTLDERDPVGAVHAIAALARIDVLADHVPLRSDLAPFELDASALELLREDTIPALAAWDAMWTALREPARLASPALVGFARPRVVGAVPSALVARVPPQAGALFWLGGVTAGELRRLTGPERGGPSGDLARSFPLPFTLSPDPDGWTVQVGAAPPQRLLPDAPVAIGHDGSVIQWLGR